MKLSILMIILISTLFLSGCVSTFEKCVDERIENYGFSPSKHCAWDVCKSNGMIPSNSATYEDTYVMCDLENNGSIMVYVDFRETDNCDNFIWAVMDYQRCMRG